MTNTRDCRPSTPTSEPERAAVDRRTFIGAGVAFGAVAAAGFVLRADSRTRSGLTTDEVSGIALSFASARSRPGFEATLRLSGPLPRRARVHLAQRRPDRSHAVLGHVDIDANQTDVTITTPQTTLADEERARESYTLVAMLIPDDGPSDLVLPSAELEVVVTPFTMGL